MPTTTPTWHTPAGPAPQPPRRPSRLRQRVTAAWRSLADELAARWLEHLGALVLVAAATGFVVFAAPQLPDVQRWLASAAVPLVLIGAAAVLSRAGARIGAAAAEVAAAAAALVVALGTVADVAGDASTVVRHGAMAAVCLVGAAAARTRAAVGAPDLRGPAAVGVLAGPALWAGAGFVASALGVPPSAAFVAAGGAALITAVVARRAVLTPAVAATTTGAAIVAQAGASALAPGDAWSVAAVLAAGVITAATVACATAGRKLAGLRRGAQLLAGIVAAIGVVGPWGETGAAALALAVAAAVAADGARASRADLRTLWTITALVCGLASWRLALDAVTVAPELLVGWLVVAGGVTALTAAGADAAGADRRATDPLAVAGVVLGASGALTALAAPAALWAIVSGDVWLTATGTALGTVAAALVAATRHRRAFIDLAGALGLVTMLLVGLGVIDRAATWTTLWTATAVVCTSAALHRPLQRTGAWTSCVAATFAAGSALVLLPQRAPLVVVLVVAAAQLGTLAVRTGRALPAALAPLPATAAWVLAVSGRSGLGVTAALAGAGAALCIQSEVLRLAARRRGDAPGAPLPRAAAALELAGVAVIALPGLRELVDGSLTWGLVPVVTGALVAAWGARTRVRRRVVVGAATVGITLTALLVLPLIGRLADVGAPLLWGGLGLVGAVLLGAGALVERRGPSGRSDDWT